MAQLSLWKWIKKQPVGLPDPTKTTKLSEAAATASADREANRIYESSVTVNVHSESTTLPSVRAKWGSYHAFTDEIRAKIGRHALEHGNTCAVKHFTKELYFDIKESTVRNFKKAYIKKLQSSKDSDSITSLPNKNRGRPLKLGNIDSQVQVYLRKLLSAGGIVNRTVTLAAAKGIILSRAPHLYKDNLLGRKCQFIGQNHCLTVWDMSILKVLRKPERYLQILMKSNLSF